MKEHFKLKLVAVVLLVLCLAAWFAVKRSDSAYYYPLYWITGKIVDPDSVGTKGKNIIFYETEEELKKGAAVYAKSEDKYYLINTFSVPPTIEPFSVVGKTYYVFIPNSNPDKPSEGYGANPVEVKLSGSGVDVADLILSKGAGGGDIPITLEPTPEIKVWFGKRVYQKTLVEKDKYQFIVPKKPKISITIAIEKPYSLDINSNTIILDADTANSKTYSIKSTEVSERVSVLDVPEQYGSITIKDFLIPDEIPDGEHTFTVSAKSSGTKGIAATGSYTAKVVVKSGPVEVLDDPWTYPSPYSPTKNTDGVEIQYTLSVDADIEIYIFSIAGERSRKIVCPSGAEGGTAGLNKVKWNGRLDAGGIVGNGIYVGTIVSRTDGRLLKKFKLNVFD